MGSTKVVHPRDSEHHSFHSFAFCYDARFLKGHEEKVGSGRQEGKGQDHNSSLQPGCFSCSYGAMPKPLTCRLQFWSHSPPINFKPRGGDDTTSMLSRMLAFFPVLQARSTCQVLIDWIIWLCIISTRIQTCLKPDRHHQCKALTGFKVTMLASKMVWQKWLFCYVSCHPNDCLQQNVVTEEMHIWLGNLSLEALARGKFSPIIDKQTLYWSVIAQAHQSFLLRDKILENRSKFER